MSALSGFAFKLHQQVKWTIKQFLRRFPLFDTSISPVVHLQSICTVQNLVNFVAEQPSRQWTKSKQHLVCFMHPLNTPLIWNGIYVPACGSSFN